MPNYDRDHVSIFYDVIEILQNTLFLEACKSKNKLVFRKSKIFGETPMTSPVVDWVRTPYYCYHAGFEDEYERTGYISIMLYNIPIVRGWALSDTESESEISMQPSGADETDQFVTYFNVSECLVTPREELNFHFHLNEIPRKDNIVPLFRIWLNIPRDMQTELSLHAIYEKRKRVYYARRRRGERFNKKLMPFLFSASSHLSQQFDISPQHRVLSNPDLLQAIWDQGLKPDEPSYEE